MSLFLLLGSTVHDWVVCWWNISSLIGPYCWHHRMAFIALLNKSKVGRHHPKGEKQVYAQKQRDGEQYAELNDDKIMIWSEWSDGVQTALSYMDNLSSDGHVYKRIAWRLCLRKWFLSPDLWFEAMTATAVSCDLPYLEQRQAETTGRSGPWLWLLSPPSSPSPPFPPPPPSSSDNSIVNIYYPAGSFIKFKELVC